MVAVRLERAQVDGLAVRRLQVQLETCDEDRSKPAMPRISMLGRGEAR